MNSSILEMYMSKQLLLAVSLVFAFSSAAWAHEVKYETSTSQKSKKSKKSKKAKKAKKKGHVAPIDCPFAKKGLHKPGMKPFKDIQKYIQMLERKDRSSWQKPDVVVKALGLKGHEKIADVGAGSGYFSFRFAKVLPKGKVYSIDVEPEMLRYIHHTTIVKGINNVFIVFGEAGNPKVPKDSNVVFICDVLHHVQKRALWLKRIFDAVASGTRIVVLEFKEGKLPKGPPAKMKIPKKSLIKMFTKAGFKMHSEKPKLLPYQEFIVFKKP
ncbi:MAG: hypothetical protein CL932_04150 [Deltaproteobacteria bacterium]|nr:hypothetical protein [Deltaproteobacteria bacterium]|tara:strand:- start:667 stop:1473 length:807 start_codon:yes stop_codon:yes gene_type:complete